MTTRLANWAASGLIVLAGACASDAAVAEDMTVVGPLTRIELAADGRSATATLKDGRSGADVTVTITDELTLDKFKDKRIVEGDEIRTRFDNGDARHGSKSFRKTAGC